jgi:acetolactate synthase-1/2/3 large subunit
VEKAIAIAEEGVPGPVFIEVAVDLLYPASIVKGWYMKESGGESATGLGARALGLYLKGHLYKQFHLPHVPLDVSLPDMRLSKTSADGERQIAQVADMLRSAERPVIVLGNQTMVGCRNPAALADALRTLGVPTFLAGAGRGLLGRFSEIQFRHGRGKALKEADLVIVSGFPFDFRMKYGRGFGKSTKIVSVNLREPALV